MKRTAALGFVIVLMMTLALGKSPKGSQQVCGVTCLSPFIMMDPPHAGTPIPYEGRHHEGGPPPDHLDRDKKPPRGRRAPETDHPAPTLVEQVMAVAREIDPALAAQLMTICETDPEAFETIINRQRHRFGSLIRLRTADPKLFEIKVTELKTDAEIYNFTEQLRGFDFDSPNAAAQIAQLQGLVSAKTRLSIKAQRLYIDRLERHLQGLRQQLKQTTKDFDAIVEGRVHQLIDIVQKDKQFELP